MPSATPPPGGTAIEVLWIFLWLYSLGQNVGQNVSQNVGQNGLLEEKGKGMGFKLRTD